MEQENKLIAKAVKWAVEAAEEIRDVGGNPALVLAKFPPELIATMVRNNLGIVAFEE